LTANDANGYFLEGNASLRLILPRMNGSRTSATVFDLAGFIEACRTALEEPDSARAISSIMSATISDQAAFEAALHVDDQLVAISERDKC